MEVGSIVYKQSRCGFNIMGIVSLGIGGTWACPLHATHRPDASNVMGVCNR